MQVKRRIHLDAGISATLWIFLFIINWLSNKIKTAHLRGSSLKPFCNHVLHTFDRPSPTDLSTSLVDKSAQPAVFVVVT